MLNSNHKCPPHRELRRFICLLVNKWNTAVMVRREGGHLCFPQLESGEIVSYGTKMSECFSHGVETLCGTKYNLVFLYSPFNDVYNEGTSPYEAIFEVVSPLEPDSEEPISPESNAFEWMPITNVRQLMKQPNSTWLQEPFESKALRALTRSEHEVLEEGRLRPWELPNWYTETRKEATDILANLGYNLKNRFEQVQNCKQSSILRCETEKGYVYLKAGNKWESKTTAIVARFAPYLVREPIFVNEEKEWMLMDDYGQTLEDEGDFTVMDYERLYQPMAKLHLESLKHIEQLKEAGVPQVSADSLIQRTKKMLEDDEVRRRLGVWIDFERVTKDGIADLGEYFEAVCIFLRDLYENPRFPLSLVHGDLNRGNIIKNDDDSYIFFDWGCSRIDSPLADIRSLRDQISCDDEELEGISMEPYFKLWKEHASPSELHSYCRPYAMIETLVTSLEEFEYASKLFEFSWEGIYYLRNVLVYVMDKVKNKNE